jgi:cyclopropane-fatty-acyl-phospholipid synthase
MIDTFLEKNLLPNWLIRIGIRRLLKQRVAEITPRDKQTEKLTIESYVADLKKRPIAECTDAANDQHYEVPAAFYEKCLGKNLKYSGCLYSTGTESLSDAEDAMLALYAERAELKDGQTILELGCGWGSLSLYMAKRFPNSTITGVSNSNSQKEYIDNLAKQRGLTNVTIITCDINNFNQPKNHFDRVVSIEMFEHMKNYQLLLNRISTWLKQDGKLFVHIFTHCKNPYHFIAEDSSDWMARYFFTGGQMPSHDLLSYFQDDMRLVKDWKVNGKHYQQTAEHWLLNMQNNKASIMPVFVKTYGKDAVKFWAYWKIFYMSCAELWGYNSGNEWIVSHYLFEKKPTT